MWDPSAEFSQRHFSTTLLGSSSAIAIHNVRFPDRIRAIYEEISGILVSGGCFLNCDLVFNKSADLKTRLNWLRELGLERVQ